MKLFVFIVVASDVALHRHSFLLRDTPPTVFCLRQLSSLVRFLFQSPAMSYYGSVLIAQCILVFPLCGWWSLVHNSAGPESISIWNADFFSLQNV